MSLTTQAQRFFNLTAEQVRIDSLLPVFTHHVALGQHYADSTYRLKSCHLSFYFLDKIAQLLFFDITHCIFLFSISTDE